jgi:hypothetical protein
VNLFLHQCANMTWSMKGSGGPLLLIICSFYRHKCKWLFKELSCHYLALRVVMAIRKTSFRFGVLPSFSPIFLHDLLLLLVMGLGPRFCVFSPLCTLHFWVWPFVWISILSFFFSCSLARCFSCIYLLIKKGEQY